MSFIQYYELNNDKKHFKLNIEPNHTTLAGHEFEHDILFAYDFDMLGSIDANSGDCLLGWDTDQFNFDVKKINYDNDENTTKRWFRFRGIKF